MAGGREYVTGIAVLDDDVYLVRNDATEVEVYSGVGTSPPSRRLAVAGLLFPKDMTANEKSLRLYVLGYKEDATAGAVVYEVESRNGTTTTTRWPVNDSATAIAMTSGDHVLVTCDGKLKEFTTNGTLIREVRLRRSESDVHLLHAVEFDGGYVVSHGYAMEERGIMIVDSTGAPVHSFDGQRDSSTLGDNVGSVAHLAVDDDGCVFATDTFVGRILLLSPTLGVVRVLISRDDYDAGPLRPIRLCLDGSRGRIFVANMKTPNNVLIFKLLNV